jgi:Spy/CpxP family protein refolding chaperone
MATPTLAADAALPVHGQFRARLAEKLNLSDEQKAQSKSIRASIQANDANETTVRAASARVAAVQADLAVERMKIYGKIAPILTDEQRRQIADFEQRTDDVVDGVIARVGERLGD